MSILYTIFYGFSSANYWFIQYNIGLDTTYKYIYLLRILRMD